MSHCSVPTLIGIHDAIQVSCTSKASFQRKHRMFVHYFGSLFVLKECWKNQHSHTKDFLCQYLMLLHLLLCAAELHGGISSHLLWNLSSPSRKICHHSPDQETLLSVLVSINDEQQRGSLSGAQCDSAWLPQVLLHHYTSVIVPAHLE